MYIFGLGGAVEQQVIKCACGAERRLGGILEADLNSVPATSIVTNTLVEGKEKFGCRGLKAWVGAVQEKCDRPLVGALSTGTNVYYSDVRSSIFLPTMMGPDSSGVSQSTLDALEGASVEYLYRSLSQDATDEQLTFVAGILSPQTGLAPSEVLAGLRYLLARRGTPDSSHSSDFDYDERIFRQDEYKILASENPTNTQHLIVEPAALTPWLAKYFSRISLVRRLRETRALAGFSRLAPGAPVSLRQKRSMLWRDEPQVPELRWLPGYFVHGEGIFLEIKKDLVTNLKASSAVRNRLATAQASRIIDRSPAFILLHTLAHLLIRKLSFECGYGAAALRERLYVLTEPTVAMHGILIYTAQSDSEGSMGGLVRMGQPDVLDRIIRSALEEARWCSSDPVCRELGREVGQGPHHLNGAACHACCHLPETSCECFNLLLDRNILIGDEAGVGGALSPA